MSSIGEGEIPPRFFSPASLPRFFTVRGAGHDIEANATLIFELEFLGIK
jgi:hypothetical protein